MKYLASAVLSILMSCSTESTQKNHQSSRSPLPADTAHLAVVTSEVKGMYPVVITNDLRSTQQFYITWFGYRVVFESSWFILLSSPGENASMVAFMDEVHPSAPPSPKAANGEGMFLTIDVADSKKIYESLKDAGASFAYELKDEPWGQRRFAMKDPNGIWIDVVEQVQPKEGWWDQYMMR